MSCYHPWCGVGGRLCVECAQDLRRETAARDHALQGRLIDADGSVIFDYFDAFGDGIPAADWDRACGALSFHAGEPYDWQETAAWREGYEDEIGIELDHDLEEIAG